MTIAAVTALVVALTSLIAAAAAFWHAVACRAQVAAAKAQLDSVARAVQLHVQLRDYDAHQGAGGQDPAAGRL